MSEVTRIMITLAPPQGSFPGKIAEGYYRVTDGAAFLTYKDGTPIDRYRLMQKLKPDDNPKAVACNMLRSRYSGSSHNFNRPLTYPRMKF